MKLVRRMRVLTAATALVVGAGLVGCQSSGGEYSSSSSTSSSTYRTGTNGASASVAADTSSSSRTRAAAQTTGNKMYYPTGERETSVLLLERVGPERIRVGQPYNYQIRVTNLTDQSLQGVTVQEMLPGSFTVTSEGSQAGAMRATGNAEGAAAGAGRTGETSGPGASAGVAVGSKATGTDGPGASARIGVGTGAEGGVATGANSDRATGAQARAGGATTQPSGAMAAGGAGMSMAPHTYAIGELGPKESRTINVSGTASQPGVLNSCMSVSYDPTLCTTAMVIAPELRLAKEAIGTGDICELQTLRYTVSNSGTGDLTGVRVDDPLPDGLTTAEGSNRVTFNVGTLSQGQSRAFEVKVKPARAGQFSSAATATADDGLQAKSEATALAVKAPKLEVTLKAPEREYMGQQVNYEVTVKNTGDAPARNTMVRIDAAGDATAAAGANGAQPAAAREGGQQVGELAPGASKTVTVAYPARTEGDMRVNAVATDPCAGSATATGQTRVTSIPALLLSAVDDHDPIRVGENVIYTITVLNQGFGADKNIKVVATLPDGQQYVSSAGASEGAVAGNKVTFAPVPTIAAKQTLTWTLTVKATKAADVRLRVDMTSDSFPEAAVKIEPTRLY